MADFIADFKADFILNFIQENRWKFIATGLKNTLVITFLCGCFLASSSVILPLSTSSDTKEWSRVSFLILPSLKRYILLSPMWAAVSFLPKIKHIVSVVPIPFSLSSVPALEKTALFAYLYQIDYWFKEYKMRLED